MNRRLLSVAGLAGGLFCLALFALHFSAVPAGAPLTAATWLGDQQGIPAGYLGRVTPDMTSCMFGEGANPQCINTPEASPLFSGIWPPQGYRTFFSGLLSISPTDASAGTYPTNTYVAEHWTTTKDMGPGGYHQECSGGENNTCTDYYDQCPYPVAPATKVSIQDLNNYLTFFPNPNYDSNNPQAPGKGPYECWGQKLVPEYPTVGGINPSEPGQTAYVKSSYSTLEPIKDLGPATVTYDPDTGFPTYDCSGYTPAVPGDQITIVGTDCWEVRSNPSNVLHGNQILRGAVPAVDPGDSLTVQWSCQPSRTVIYKYRDCTSIPGGQICGNFHTPTEYSINPLFTSATSPDFTVSGLRGKATITAPAKPQLYTYSLTCQGPKPLTLSVSFRVKSTTGITCKIATINTLGTGKGADLVHGSAWEVKATVEGTAYDFCINNPTTNSDFFVPLTTKNEVDNFLAAVDADSVGNGTDVLYKVY
jgi:hypothetical protein